MCCPKCLWKTRSRLRFWWNVTNKECCQESRAASPQVFELQLEAVLMKTPGKISVHVHKNYCRTDWCIINMKIIVIELIYIYEAKLNWLSCWIINRLQLLHAATAGSIPDLEPFAPGHPFCPWPPFLSSNGRRRKWSRRETELKSVFKCHFLSCLFQFRVGGKLESIPVPTRGEAGFAQTRLPAYRWAVRWLHFNHSRDVNWSYSKM